MANTDTTHDSMQFRSVETNCRQGDCGVNRTKVLFKNMLRCSNTITGCNIDTERTPIKPRTSIGTWSVYKQLVPVLRPQKLSCMASADDVVRTPTLDAKAKIKKMELLEHEIQAFIANETPIDRIKRAYTVEKHTGKPTAQMQNLKKTMKATFLALFAYGGYKGHQAGKEEFKQKTKLVMFASKGAAYKKKSNYLVQCVMKEGMRMAFKGGVFAFTIFIVHQWIELYMNKSSPLSYTIAGGVGASLVSISLGPKGMLSRFIICSTLGFIGGSLSYVLLRIFDETQEKINYLSVKSMLMERRTYQNTKIEPVEYHEEVDDMDT